MQHELDTTATLRHIQILGVNYPGLESGNSVICDGHVLPWLQDSTQVNAWGKWNATFRDVVILDARNVRINAYNLTVHDLGITGNYDELKQILLTAANQPATSIP